VSDGRRKAPPAKGRPKAHWALRVGGWLVGLFCFGVIAAGAIFFIGYQLTDIPDPNKEFKTNTTTVYYSDGRSVMGTFYEQNRRSVPLSKIPKHVQDAIIAAEDRTFWTNPGISPSGMARAAFNIARGEQLQGGSTITQQYVKIMYLTQERNLSRKFSELFIATKLSRSEDKNSILEGYLNTIYFGEGAYGIAAAGDTYFSVRDPKDLTIEQAALLATILNNPTRFDTDNPDNKKRILERYRYVLDGMRQIGTITDAQYASMSKALPKLEKKKKSDRFGGAQGFLLDMARRELERWGFKGDEISGGGLKVTTTFDKDLQKAAVAAAQNEHPDNTKDLHIGLASVRPGKGELVAMYGGPNYLKSQLNWATTKARPGSSFKPFAVAAALEDGISLQDEFQGDSPIEIQGQKLRNELNTDYGRVSLLEATEQSVNTAFYDLVDNKMDNGPDEVVTMAEAAGIPKTTHLERGRNNPSTVLGPDPYASPVDIANAYATFAADGMYAPLHTIKTVKGPDGKTLWSADKEKKLKPLQRIDPEIAKLTTFALQKVVTDRDGTGNRAQELDRPVAGKTGTAGGLAVEHRAANGECKGRDCSDTLTSWWTGFTPQLSTSVLYRAGKTGESDLDRYSDDPAFFGGNWPVKTWLAYMQPALDGVKAEEFEEPDEDRLAENTQTQEPVVIDSNPPEPPPTTQTPDEPPAPPSEPTSPESSTPPSTKPTRTRHTIKPPPSFTPPTSIPTETPSAPPSETPKKPPR
jgi:membrane peptidoglycan carboxypeptidase